jgi:tetratricopeptide (TPR) repeat protein
MLMAGCSMHKNTSTNRFWQSFTAKYNTYYNGSQAYIDGTQEKEKGNKDNYTEMLPLFPVGNKNSRALGKGNFDRTIEKMEKTIKQHSIKAKPEWKKSRRKTAKDKEWLGRREYNPFLWKAWLMMGQAQYQKGEFEEAAATFSYMSRLYLTQPQQNGIARAWLARCYAELDWLYDAEDVIRNMSRDSIHYKAQNDWDAALASYYLKSGEFEKAVPYLRKTIRHEHHRIQKAREWFLMGQVQSTMGNREEAYKAYQKVIRQNPPYELEFNARIAQTEVMAKGNYKKMINRL